MAMDGGRAWIGFSERRWGGTVSSGEARGRWGVGALVVMVVVVVDLVVVVKWYVSPKMVVVADADS